MSELFQANLDIIRRRWPDMAACLLSVTSEAIDALGPTLIEGHQQTISVGGKQLSSRHDRDKEAALLLSHIKDGGDPLMIFGMGLGDVPALALARWPERRVELCLMSAAVTAMVLHFTDQTGWLNNPRISFRRPVWSDCYRGPWTAIIPELQLADTEVLKVRDHLYLELQRPFVDLQHQIAEKEAAPRIEQTVEKLTSLPDVSSLFINQKSPIVVIGSGPSLEQAYAWLKKQKNDLPNMGIIAADTAHKALISHGIVPDIVVTMDAKISVAHLEIAHSALSTLVCFPTTDPLLIDAWQGPCVAALTKSPTQDKFGSHTQLTRLFSGGSVIHPALDIAAKSATNKIILCGCDFGFPGGKSHAFWEDGILGVSHDNAGHNVLSYQGINIATTLNMRGYLLAVEVFIKRHPHIQFLNHSALGAKIEGCPPLGSESL
ncbi:motility associated factor glycosyltransferase family protein [Shewanella sp.]|uniref:motility associated factor glycosyltransferase family protein n=1 Tax=Shewanella sp. TaxID=50422 RepID=UPI0035658475